MFGRGKSTSWLAAAILLANVFPVSGDLAASTDDSQDLPAGTNPAESETADPIVEPLRLSMEFEEANLKEVLRTFSQQSGLNLIATGAIADKPVTLYLESVTVLDALDQILRANDLTYERPHGSDIYIVKPRDAAAQTVTRVYRLKYARVSASVLAKAATAFGDTTPFEASNGLDGEAGTSSGGNETSMGVDKVVEPLLSEQGSVTVDARTNSLLITDLPGNFPRIEAALVALDVRTTQVMVETELLETSLTKLRDLGIEWGNGSEGNFLEVIPAKRTSRFPYSTIFGRKEGDATGITLGTIDSSQARAVLQALASDSETRILARPKVLTLNNESAVIRMTTDQAIGFSTTSVSDTGAVTAETERATTGILMVVTPQVNERGDITMMVEPSVTKVVAAKVTSPDGSTIVDPKTRSVRALVRVRSGDTLVLGGLIDRSEEATVKKVPILGDMPYVGGAFRNTETSDTSSELVVFVTPRVLEDGPSMPAAGPRRTPAGALPLQMPAPTVLPSMSAPAQPTPVRVVLGRHEQEPARDRSGMMENAMSSLEDPNL